MDTTPAASIGATPPQPRAVVVPDRDGVLHVDHLSAPPVQPITAPEPAFIPPAPIVPVAVPSAPVPSVVEVVPPAPMTNPVAMPAPPVFSPVTPVYAPTPTNTAADIAQPAVKGLEFVSSPTPTVLPAPVQPVAPPQVTPPSPVISGPINSIDGVIGGSSQSITLPASQQTGAIDMPAPIPTPDMGVSQLEQTVQDIDIDQMIDSMPNLTQAIETPAPVAPIAPSMAVVSSTPPPLSQSIPQPQVAPASSVSVNPVANYFQSMTSGAATVPSVIASQAGSGFAKFKKPLIIAGIAVLVLATGIYAITAVVTNNNAKQAIKTTPTTTTTDVATTPDTTTNDTTTDTTTTPPVTTTPEAPAVTPPVTTPAPAPTPAPSVTPTPTVVPTTANTAAYDGNISEQPRSVTINKLGVRASIENVGVTSTGAMGVPSSIWNAGWYTGSALPGTSGAVFVDGHASSNRNGLFGNLDKLQSGDRIGIVRNDGKAVSYKVVEVKIVDRNAVDMASMLRPHGNADRGLNLMSCSGSWIESEQTLQNRVLVYAIEV